MCDMCDIRDKEHKEQGAVTLEAAIALPLFMCVVMMISFLLRAIYVQEYVQHAITQAVAEIAGSSYLYEKLEALDDKSKNLGTMNSIAEGIAESSENTNLNTNINTNTNTNRETLMNIWKLEEWFPNSVAFQTNELLDSLALFADMAANGVEFERYLRYTVGGYLKNDLAETEASLNQRLHKLNVSGGYDGFDFSGSEYLLNESGDARINVKYVLAPPLSIKAFPGIAITQKARARAWLYGSDGVDDVSSEAEAEEDIWSKGNFDRGKVIQEVFHANLPFTFPGLSSFENGEATLIKSIDTTAKSYQNENTLSKVIKSYVNDIKTYEGQVQPWGSDGITIMPEDILIRRLLLVIPSNVLDNKLSDVIDACIRDAINEGVILQVERYGFKQ